MRSSLKFVEVLTHIAVKRSCIIMYIILICRYYCLCVFYSTLIFNFRFIHVRLSCPHGHFTGHLRRWTISLPIIIGHCQAVRAKISKLALTVPQLGVLTLTNPRRGVLTLTLTDPRTDTDPYSWPKRYQFCTR